MPPKPLTTEEFIQKAKSVHGSYYDYSFVVYENCRKLIKILCPKHGSFYQEPRTHIQKKGCPECGLDRVSKNVNQFIKDAIEKHNKTYDYSKVEYKNKQTKIKIGCDDHGWFRQLPNSHLQGQGCPLCAIGYCVSKKEKQWLNYKNIPNDKNNRQVKILGYMVDGFMPETNTVYEFYGDFWHGNPLVYNSQFTNPVNGQKMGDLYKKTKERESKLISNGYNLITIWESDWNNSSE